MSWGMYLGAIVEHRGRRLDNARKDALKHGGSLVANRDRGKGPAAMGSRDGFGGTHSVVAETGDHLARPSVQGGNPFDDEGEEGQHGNP